MAQLTPKDILEISEPVEQIYQRTVDELLINIARHFQITGWERTRYWEIKKLSELGALTKESVDIIAKNTGMLPEEIERAFLQVSEKACLDIDPQLRAAAEKGLLQDPGTSATTSPEIRRMVRAFSEQAVDKMNMTNTTMLESTRQAYVKAVQQVASEEQLQEAQRILETQSLAVTTGAETRTRAIRKAMEDLSKTGLAGFYDRAGRSWSPEAYAAMVVRTTAHNAAVESIKERQKEFGGGDVFQISSHPGARPLCAPYQGGLYTWGRGSGTVYDGDGKAYEYESIYSTSYGEAAGIFGINCGHHPIPFISGYSFRQEGPTQTPDENAKEYEESQKQRQYERDIRAAKRDLEIAKATGDEEAVKAAKQKVAKEQARMRAFIDQTGRARRYDREQIASKVMPGLQPTRPEPAVPVPTTTPRSFETGRQAAEFFGVRPERSLRRENREEYDRQREAYAQSMYGSWVDKLSGEQTTAIGNYSGDAYSGINGLLRREMTERMVEAWDRTESMGVRQMIGNIDSAIESFELTEPIRVFRTCDKDVLEVLKLEAGATFRDDGFVSTSALSKKVASGNIVMQIDVPAGTGHGAWINPLSGAQDEEYEFLLPRGAEFRINGVRQSGEDTIVEMEYLGSRKGEIEYATKEEVVDRWKRLGFYDEDRAKQI